MTSLREQKVAFVTGHSGTTSLEILLVCLSCPIGLFLYFEVSHLFQINEEKWVRSAIIEAGLVLLPMAICQTNMLYNLGLSILGVELVLANLLHWHRMMHQNKQVKNKMQKSPGNADHFGGDGNVNSVKRLQTVPFVTAYRSSVSYLTFVAILAVDFQVFPRRFAKTETHGCGLMDLGAASFVVANAIVSRHARTAATFQNSIMPGHSSFRIFKKAVLRSAPIVILGMIRFLATKGLEYQEHVSEYGIHWNFYFTLALLNICMPLLGSYTRGAGWFRFGFVFVIMTVYQYVLTWHGVQAFIEDFPRSCSLDYSMPISIIPIWACDVFVANREGILGCIGYVVLFLLSEDIATFCLWDARMQIKLKVEKCDAQNDVNKNLDSVSSKIQAEDGKRIAQCCIFFWTLLVSSDFVYNIPVSRRSTNAPFIVWCLAHNLTIMLLIWCAFYLGSMGVCVNGAKMLMSSPILNAVSRNGLVMFLVANLITGIVNLSVNTLEANDNTSVSILFGYLCAVGVIALSLDKILNLTLRLG